MKATDRYKLIERINTLEGLTDDERSALLGLLREHKTYGLVWEDKPEDVEERLRDELPVLIEDKDRALTVAGPDAPNHIIIEGDNLEALTTLAYTHAAKIDVIYIDPPYNTGNEDFKYNDRRIDSEDTFRHSKWLCFMQKRLKLAKRLLSRNGIILISIDDNEYAALKLLCDEIFGYQNFLTNFHIQVRYAEKSLNEEKPFKPLMEYVLFYAKDSSTFKPVREKVDYGLEKFCYKIKELNPGTHFHVGNQEVVVFKPGEWSISECEGNLEGLKETWITGSIYTTMSYGKVFQTIVEPRIKIDGLGCLYKVLGRGEDGRGYRYYTGPKKATATKGKMYSGVPLENVALFKSGNAPKRELPILTVFDFAPDFGNIRHEGGVPFGSGKKPVKMIKQFIAYHSNKNAIVLDFFAGSGSTAHAVMSQNFEDGGHRQSISITNNERNICEDVTYKRICNVIKGYGKEKGLRDNNLRYYRTDFVRRSRSTKNMRRLVNLSTDMLCIKDNLYTEHKTFAGLATFKNIYRYFEHGDKKMLIIYDERYVDEIVNMINRVETSSKIKVYVFSPSEDPWEANFEPVIDKVELCALPQAIYNTYKRILPKRKPVSIEPMGDKDTHTGSDEEEIGGLFAMEGGSE